MAHFAELDKNNIVLRVIVLDNIDNTDNNGVEDEAYGKAYLHRGLEGNWVQTSYNRNFRKNYAAYGYIYDSTRDAFMAPQPFNSWILNEDTCQWDSPVPYPTDDKRYTWDEPTTNWKEIN